MPREIVRDVLPRDQRTIRRIPLPESRRGKGGVSDRVPPGPPDAPVAGRVGDPRWLLWTVVVIALAALFFSFSQLFTGATVLVTPREIEIPVSLDAVAQKGAPAGALAYQRQTTVEVAKESVEADREKQVEKKASGRIIVYNQYAAVPQRFIKNTRFETPDGKIYRIDHSIVLPGRTGKDGKIIPGSIEVTVYAAAPGDAYNIGPTDFTIPGFKRDGARFEAFYARSKTPMTGGFSGAVKTISEEKRAVTRERLRKDLEAKLLLAARRRASELGRILYGDASFTRFESLPEEVDGNAVVVAERGILTAFAFDRAELSTYLAGHVLPAYDGAPIDVRNLEELAFEFRNKKDFSESRDAPLEFRLNGVARFVWRFNAEELKAALAGEPKRRIEEILRGFPSILTAEVTVRPFWKKSFPVSLESISTEERRVSTSTPPTSSPQGGN